MTIITHYYLLKTVELADDVNKLLHGWHHLTQRVPARVLPSNLNQA